MAAHPLMYLHPGYVYRVYVDLTNAKRFRDFSFLFSLHFFSSFFLPPLLLFLVMVLQSIDTTIICKITVVLRGSTMSSDSS